MRWSEPVCQELRLPPKPYSVRHGKRLRRLDGLSAQVAQVLESRSAGRKMDERTMIESLVQVVGVQRGEVLGVFSGFVPGGYMFGVNTQTGILDVLYSYYQNNVTRALKVHHVGFARLGVEESIRTISVYRNGSRIRKIDLYSYYEPFDYAYLERLVPLVSDDALIVQTVEHRADKRILRYIMP